MYALLCLRISFFTLLASKAGITADLEYDRVPFSKTATIVINETPNRGRFNVQYLRIG